MLEVLHRRELGADDVQRSLEITALVGLRDLHDAVENLERRPLRGAKRETSTDAVDVTAGHHLLPLSIPANSGSACIGIAFLRRLPALVFAPLLDDASAFASSTATTGACSVTLRL